MATDLPNALTVDVEDYFQVSAFDSIIKRSDWTSLPSRIERNTEHLLEIYHEAGVRGTFFILGWVAEHYPALVRRIAAEGHEIASHGYWHRLTYELTPIEFREDIQLSRNAIGNACGIKPTSYRAPSFSITESSTWAIDILAAEGFTVDSSIFPIRGHSRYGYPSAKREIHKLRTTSSPICEFPPTLWSKGRIQIPVGGGYFRFFPLSLTQFAINEERKSGRPAMFYTHPWEYDVKQPRVAGIRRKDKFRHFVGIKSAKKKLKQLLACNRFAPLQEVIRLKENGPEPVVTECIEPTTVSPSFESEGR